MKKTILAILLSTVAISSQAYALEQVTTPNTGAVQTQDTNTKQNEIFTNEPLTPVAVEYQKKAIDAIQKKYISTNSYPQSELQELYVSFISLGFNEAADLLYNNKNVKIDIEGYNANGFTPLMAAAMAPIKGGNVEYAKKLIELGADVNKGAQKTEVSPISVAANVNNYKVLALLLVKGALFMKEDKLNYRPIDYATKNNSVESALILREALTAKLKEVNEKK